MSNRRAPRDATRLRAALAVVVLGACGGGAGPTSTLDHYSRALAEHDFASAYELMSEEFRAKVSRDEYVQMMRDNPGEVRATADQLAARRSQPEVSAELTYGFGDTMRLVNEGGEWRIADNPIAFYEHSSPRAALRSFLRAYRLERWDIMLRYVPEAYRARMDAEKMKAQFTGPSRAAMELLMNLLEANADEPIVERGASARLAYGSHYEVKFVREGGAWLIEDLD
ncbi:MAG: hypothetical protein R2939_13250 [Kofleriaceae bacterium]